MAYEIYTFGGGEYLVQVFSSITLFLGSNDFTTMARLAGVFGVLWVMFTAAFGKYAPDYKYFLMFAFIYMGLLVPKADVAIVDRTGPVASGATVVANVPLGIALFGHITSTLGDGLTRMYETYITLPNDQKYTGNGMLFGAALVNNSLQLEAPDADFAHDLNNYIIQCGFWLLGRRIINEDDLAKTDDLWALLKNNASILRYVEWSYPSPTTGDYLWTCRDAAADVENRWAVQIDGAKNVLGKSLWPGLGTAVAATAVTAVMPGSYNYFTNVSKSTSALLQQQIMINAAKRAFQNAGAAADASAAAINIAQTQAEAAQRTMYSVVGNMATKFLPIFRNVLEGVIYGAFPIVAFALLLPITATVFTQYFKLLVWIQLWAPFYAIINSIMTWYGRHHTAAASLLPDGSTYSLSLQTSTSLLSANADILATAGYLSVSVPLMAWMVVAAGAVSGTALVSGLMGSMQSTASQSGGEVARGNISMGQMSMDNMRMNTYDGHKMDSNTHIRGGALTTQMSDGSSATVTQGGGNVISQAMSNLKFDASSKQNMSRAMQEVVKGGESTAVRDLANYGIAGGAALTKTLAYGSTRSSGEGGSTHYGTGQGGSKSWSASDMRTEISNWAKENNLNDSEAVSILMAAQGSVGGKYGGVVGAQVTGQIGNTSEARASEIYKSAVAFNKQHDFGNKVDQVFKDGWERTFDQKTGSAREGSDGMRSSIETAHRAGQEASTSMERYAQLSRMHTAARENGYSLSEKDSQDFVNFLVGQVGQNTALDMVATSATGDMRLGEYMGKFTQQRAEQALDAGGLQSPYTVTRDDLFSNLPGTGIVSEMSSEGKANLPTVTQVINDAGKRNNQEVDSKIEANGVDPDTKISSTVPQIVKGNLSQNNNEINDARGDLLNTGTQTQERANNAVDPDKQNLLDRAYDDSTPQKIDEAGQKVMDDVTKWFKGK